MRERVKGEVHGKQRVKQIEIFVKQIGMQLEMGSG